jgi:hypothetical protein
LLRTVGRRQDRGSHSELRARCLGNAAEEADAGSPLRGILASGGEWPWAQGSDVATTAAAKYTSPGGAVAGYHVDTGLGIKVLDIALQYAFDTPGDRVVSGVCRPTLGQKILTGWRDRIPVLRRCGQSGSAKWKEGKYSPFRGAETSTPILAGPALAGYFKDHAQLLPRALSRFRGFKRPGAGSSAGVGE